MMCFSTERTAGGSPGKLRIAISLTLALCLSGFTPIASCAVDGSDLGTATDVLTGTVVDDHAPQKSAAQPASRLTGAVSRTRLQDECEREGHTLSGTVVVTQNPYNRFPPTAIVHGVVYEPQAQSNANTAATAIGILTGVMGAVSAAQTIRSTTRTGGASPAFIPMKKKCVGGHAEF